jgi:hypothetical protein
MPPTPTPPALYSELVASCRELADHLVGYAICASNFDEDAFIAIERAERLLHASGAFVGPTKRPRPHPGMLA